MCYNRSSKGLISNYKPTANFTYSVVGILLSHSNIVRGVAFKLDSI